MRKFIMSLVFIFVVIFMITSVGLATSDKIWPTKKVTIVVPARPGGSADRISRGIAPYLSKEINAPVSIENRPGGNSVLGTASHLQTDPDDGSFLLLQTSPMYEANTLFDVPYTIEDLDCIAVINWDPLGIFVHKDSQYKTLEQLFDAIKANPSKLKYSDVPFSWGQVVMEIVEKDVLNSTSVRIPFQKGGANPRAMLLGQHVDFMPAPYSGTIAAIGPDVKCIGISKHELSSQEIPLIENVVRKYKQNVHFPEVTFMRSLVIKKSFQQKYPGRWEQLLGALKAMFKNADFQDFNKTSGFNLSLTNPVDSQELIYNNKALITKHADVFK